MSLFSRRTPPEASETQEGVEGLDEPIEGDRGIPSVNRARSVQSRVSSVLAFTLMSALGLGLLTWYYARTLSRPREVQHAAQQAAKSHAQGEMALPSLGHISPPVVRAVEASELPTAAPDPSAFERLLGPAPPLPAGAVGSPVLVAPVTPVGQDANPTKSPGELAFERRLAGPAFAHSSKDDSPPAPMASTASTDFIGIEGPRAANAGSAGSESPQTLNALLRPTVTPAVSAAILPTRRFLLSKGAFIDCTLETAVDSTLPGMTKVAVRSHPELAGTYLSLKAAELTAARRRDPEDQRRFVSLVRRALADDIERGDPLPPVRLRERGGAAPAPAQATKARAPLREDLERTV